MRRYALPLALAALAVAVMPANAAPRRSPTHATVIDPTADWPVPSEDVIKITVDTVRVDGKPVLRAVMTLSAAPDPLTEYFVGVYGPCDSWGFFNRSPLAASVTPQLSRVKCSTTSTPAPPPETAPASVAFSGTTVVFTAPYALGLTSGLRMTSVVGLASVRGGAVSAPVVGFQWTGDFAGRQVDYVLG